TFYIAHLSEPERQFIITLILENMLGWMRTLSGTTSLRALLYIDEMFGYFPPYPRNPPTKEPILRLLKQARAFGIGMILATQNPGDLDYKGLRSEEHTSELQSRENLVCRLLLEKKKDNKSERFFKWMLVEHR